MPYFKGHVRRPDKDHLIAVSNARHGAHLRMLAAVPPPATWDSRTLGLIGPIKDQAQCGSCWDFSGTACCEVAYNKAGIGGGANVFILSEEYTLDCCRNGGCNGDDNTTVLEWAKADGLPLTSAYGPYKAAPGACKWSAGMTLYPIDDWGFADSNGDGVTSEADIKAAIMQYGAVGCGIAADDAFQNNPAGTIFTGSGATQIDHDIMLVGWDNNASDPATGGFWILRNSWGPSWCEKGYIRITYGANRVGSESVWAVKHT